MPDGKYPDPRKEDIIYEDRRISRPDVSLPDWHIPDATYRPVPIVWFAAVVVIQMFTLPLMFILFLDENSAFSGARGLFFVAFFLLETGILAWWTWERGMKHAAIGWKIATFLFLGGLFALSSYSALAS